MDTIGERIKTARKALKLNQTEFAERIGLKQAAIGLWENGRNSVRDNAIVSICREYGINETWLRTGKGDMFISSDSSVVAQLVQQYGFKPIEQKMLEAYIALPAQYREGVLRYVETLIASVTGEPAKTLEEMADEEAANYRQEWLEERKGQTLSVSGDGSENTAG